MTSVPNISIILPVYNGEKHSRKCLDSVLAQTYSDFELIIWDDVSWDDSCKILRSYHDPRIRVYANAQNCADRAAG